MRDAFLNFIPRRSDHLERFKNAFTDKMISLFKTQVFFTKVASVWPLDQAKKGFLECKNSVLFIGTQDNFKLPGRRSALLSMQEGKRSKGQA